VPVDLRIYWRIDLPSPVSAVHSLEIGRYDGEPTYELVQIDDLGGELARTHCESVEAAMRRASVDFGVEPRKWERIEHFE
jgi:hypothetical protein